MTATLLKATAAAADFRRTVARIRERLTAQARSVIAQELTRQRREVAARTGQTGKAVFTVWDAAQLVPDWHAARLRRAMHNVYARALAETYGESLTHFGLRGRLTAEDTRAFVEATSERLVGVTDTTRNAVRLALREGLLARDTPAQLADRLRGLPEFNDARALLVAETEMSHATGAAAMTAYERDGRVLGVVVHDQERCAPGGPCVGWNGRELSMAEAGATALTFHPRCGALRSPVMQTEGDR
jgi:hypothetical protein